ncbi:MAG: hypothetical protein GY869_05950, partial [Planctomycetes bacterium]|nr:hypothetical protein [Planctomycetota bacterium]
LITNDPSPPLTGSIDDLTAQVRVTVNNQTYDAIVNPDYTWSLPDDTLPNLTEGVYDVQVAATDPAGNIGHDQTNDELNITFADLDKPHVLDVIINNGDAQRSMLTSAKIVFNEQMNIDALIANGSIADHVQLFDKADPVNPINSLDASHYQYNNLTNTLSIDFTIDGFGGSELTSPTDTRYQLKLNTATLTDLAGNPLHDNDAIPDNFLIIDRSTNATHQDLFRFFGDSDGDADVDFADTYAFRLSQFKTDPDPAYNWIFDADGDGDVDFADMFKMRANYERGSLP